jgi:Helix-turn-helix domain
MRFRLYPSAAQEVLLAEQCGHARYVWNLALEQPLMWRRWKGSTPGFNAQSVQLTEAWAAERWLACGSQTVQQQGLRDLDQGWRNFFAGTHRRPRWRKAGEHEGLRIVGPVGLRVRQDNCARVLATGSLFWLDPIVACRGSSHHYRPARALSPLCGGPWERADHVRRRNGHGTVRSPRRPTALWPSEVWRPRPA